MHRRQGGWVGEAAAAAARGRVHPDRRRRRRKTPEKRRRRRRKKSGWHRQHSMNIQTGNRASGHTGTAILTRL
jgi:hypothetical protein